jgi:hypothetical protein
MAIKIQHCIRTLRLKVKSEGYAWLNAAAIEVNQVWNFANATSYKAARPYVGAPKWLSAFDLNNLTAGASKCFDRIGSETIQQINAEFATRRKQHEKLKLRWRVSSGSKRSLEWVPFKALQLKRKGTSLGFSGKAFRVFERLRLEGISFGLRETVATSDGEKLEAGHFYRSIEKKIANAQRRGHKRQAKRLHRTAARGRKDALHKFSRKIVNAYQTIFVAT